MPIPTRPTVLVADDEPQLLRLVLRMLKRSGYAVVAAPDGPAALEAFEKDPEAIDVAVLDAALVPNGAIEVVESMRAERPELGVVVMSGDQPGGALRASLAACDGRFLRKPFLPEALLAAIQEVLAERPA